jgi:hypothetical protein
MMLSCDDAGQIIADGGGGSGDGGWSEGPHVPDMLGPPKECNPACTAPQVCSYAGVCIDPGTCAHDADCEGDLVCDPVTKTCVVKDECGAQEIKADVVPPNLLLVLDRSCSMTGKVGSSNKWQIAVDALVKLTTTFKDKIRFGLSLFPDTTGDKCTQDAVAIPVGPGKEAAIQALLTAALAKSDPNFPDGPCVTNIDTAMEQAAGHQPLKDTSRQNFVALITDGKQYGCNDAGGDSGTTQIITDLFGKDSVATFVVGFGNGVDPKQLDIFAAAGGVPSSDPNNKFYKAEDQASLDQALAAIAQKAFGCVFTLEQVPELLDKIYVFFDNKEVPKDPSHVNGWDYDPTTNKLTIYGQACKDLQAGKITDVDIVYGCKKPLG